jgi:hypothetical protein
LTNAIADCKAIRFIIAMQLFMGVAGIFGVTSSIAGIIGGFLIRSAAPFSALCAAFSGNAKLLRCSGHQRKLDVSGPLWYIIFLMVISKFHDLQDCASWSQSFYFCLAPGNNSESSALARSKYASKEVPLI